MAPTPPSTNSSTGARSPEEQYRVVRKRNRVPLSCHPCRTKKLKCDRQQPCSNCTKRDPQGAQSCSYATPSHRKKKQDQADGSPDEMQHRIDRLEGLVLSLMQGGGNIAPASAASASTRSEQRNSTSVSEGNISTQTGNDEAGMADEDDYSDVDDGLATSIGVLKVDQFMGKSMYIGQEHWHMILADIAEVKNFFINHKSELVDGYNRVRSSKPVIAKEGPTLLLHATPAPEVEIRAGLPPKSTVLELCAKYFASMDNAVGIVHSPSFQQQLKQHWEDPLATPIMWLGLLYAILTLAMLSYHKAGDEPPAWKGKTLELAAQYRQRTVQCLLQADYTKPGEFTVETMLLYTLGEYSSRWDAELGLWLIVSVIVRVAFRMGYHRDAKWFPSISPFQAEMRRRTWALLRMTDIIFAHSVSLPSMIHDHDCDTQLPNNLHDEDIYPGIKALPPSRPDTEPTPVSYMATKAKMCFALGNILQVTNRVGNPVSYDEIIKFDARLRQLKKELPPHLRLTSLEGCRSPPTLIIARFNLEILYLKIVCLLHRKYLPRARQNPRYAHSRRSAIEASMVALEHLSLLHKESLPGGKLRSLTWFINSIATKDFLLPAMLIMLDLHFDNITKQAGISAQTEGGFLWSPEERTRMFSALRSAQKIWATLAGTSMEAFKASRITGIMVEKLNDSVDASDEMTTTSSVPDVTRDSNDAGMTAGLSQSLAPAPSLNPLSPDNIFQLGSSNFMGMGVGSPMLKGFSNDGFGSGGSGNTPMSLFSGMTGLSDLPDMTNNVDWNAFENFTQMAPWGPDQTFQVYGTDNTTEQVDDNAFTNVHM